MDYVDLQFDSVDSRKPIPGEDQSSSGVETVGEGVNNGTLPRANPSETLDFNDEGAPPWESEGYDAREDETDPELAELDIFRKAENFKKINLISGNRVEGGVDTDYIRQHYGARGLQRYKLGQFVMSKLGYRPSPDVLLMLSCTNKARVVIATAGAGKTTSLQFDIVISKMLDKALGENILAPQRVEDTSVYLPRILYLNYNKHNVQMISNRHKAVCSAVNKLLKPSDAITDELESSTVHALCHKWLRAFSSEVELPELSIITDEQKEQIWTSVITPRWKKFYGDTDVEVDWQKLDELYTFQVESMLDWDAFFETAKFVDCQLRQDFVKSCLKKYESMKRLMKLMDFTDYLVLMTETLKTHEDLRTKLQERYRIIIADENQDFTRLMNELLIQLYNPKYNSLVVVGDPDQTIYDFKGVSPDNVVELTQLLPDVQMLGLDTNYRCPDTVVDAAKAILKMNILRFEKPINTVRTGGRIIPHPISSGEKQEDKVLSVIKGLSSEDLINTVITYRNNASSVIIAEELYYAGIPFKILDSRRPFNNPVFRHIYRCLKALRTKDDFQLNRELYRFIPLSKEDWYTILENNRSQLRMHLHDIVPPANLPSGCIEALSTLVKISMQVETQPVCDFIMPLIRLYRKYYFDFVVRQTTYISTDAENYQLYLERAIKFFSRQMTLSYMDKELAEHNVDNEGGITLSTFHGLKGLEFDYVLAIDFNEAIFPNFFDIESRYSRNTAMEEKESANRLCYVLVTRTIKEFHMFYNSMDPSVYVNILLKATGSKGAPEEAKDTIALGSVGGFNSASAKMNFVNRLIGGR